MVFIPEKLSSPNRRAGIAGIKCPFGTIHLMTVWYSEQAVNHVGDY